MIDYINDSEIYLVKTTFMIDLTALDILNNKVSIVVGDDPRILYDGQ